MPDVSQGSAELGNTESNPLKQFDFNKFKESFGPAQGKRINPFEEEAKRDKKKFHVLSAFPVICDKTGELNDWGIDNFPKISKNPDSYFVDALAVGITKHLGIDRHADTFRHMLSRSLFYDLKLPDGLIDQYKHLIELQQLELLKENLPGVIDEIDFSYTASHAAPLYFVAVKLRHLIFKLSGEIERSAKNAIKAKEALEWQKIRGDELNKEVEELRKSLSAKEKQITRLKNQLKRKNSKK